MLSIPSAGMSRLSSTQGYNQVKEEEKETYIQAMRLGYLLVAFDSPHAYLDARAPYTDRIDLCSSHSGTKRKTEKGNLEATRDTSNSSL